MALTFPRLDGSKKAQYRARLLCGQTPLFGEISSLRFPVVSYSNPYASSTHGFGACRAVKKMRLRTPVARAVAG
jgi:hypothetical protein